MSLASHVSRSLIALAAMAALTACGGSGGGESEAGAAGTAGGDAAAGSTGSSGSGAAGTGGGSGSGSSTGTGSGSGSSGSGGGSGGSSSAGSGGSAAAGGSAGGGTAGGSGSGSGAGGSTGSGGSGGAAGSGGSGSDVASASGSLQTSVPTPDYAAGSQGDVSMSALNEARRNAGAGLLQQSKALDTAAQAHVQYLAINIGATGHTEEPVKPSFYEIRPELRMAKAGFAPGYSAEVINTRGTLLGVDCVGQMLATVYQASALLGPATHTGFGFSGNFAVKPICIGNFATAQSDALGQYAAAGALVAYPYGGQTNVPPDYNVDFDSPRPSAMLVPNTPAGTPVIVNMRNADYLNFRAAGTLDAVVTRFELKDAGGNAVAAVLLANQPIRAGAGVVLNADGNLPDGAIALVPLSPLAPAKTYSVSFSATLKTGGAPLAKSWSFTTR
ncbi:MAG: hypothetical protein JSR84_01235 [Proteobacteria bacterium]|nr:hypothetical protein [Pseudomonadota bacterium]